MRNISLLPYLVIHVHVKLLYFIIFIMEQIHWQISYGRPEIVQKHIHDLSRHLKRAELLWQRLNSQYSYLTVLVHVPELPVCHQKF